VWCNRGGADDDDMKAGLVRGFAGIVAMVAIGALLLQYALLLELEADGVGAGLATVRFLSYFTILANGLVALVTVPVAIRATPRTDAFFARSRVLAGVALYIGVTGIVYIAVLRHLWQPQGAQWWADTGLHYATPLLYVAWWLFGVRHGDLRLADVPRWLLFPGGYLLWCLLRGAWVHEYPYPFLDVDALGWSRVSRNAAGVLALFVVVGLLLVAIDRMLAKRRTPGTQ
jgi:hypothetical protein